MYFLALSLPNALDVAMLVISVVLSVVLLLQAKGSGFGAGLGGTTAVFRTRRGIEKSLFQFTIVLVVAFLLVDILSVRAAH
jgi:preprotein translocase subunit SecG